MLSSEASSELSPENTMSWHIDDVPYSTGWFGFTLYGSKGMLKEVEPYKENSGGEITVNEEVERIVFNNGGSNDAVILNINITKNGILENHFRCTNCYDKSTSLRLGRLHLDGNMDGDLNAPNTSMCKVTCEFVLRKLENPMRM